MNFDQQLCHFQGRSLCQDEGLTSLGGRGTLEGNDKVTLTNIINFKKQHHGRIYLPQHL